MTLKEWAEENGLADSYRRYKDACLEIEMECVEEGYPSRGSNYEMRVEQLQYSFPELFPELFENEED